MKKILLVLGVAIVTSMLIPATCYSVTFDNIVDINCDVTINVQIPFYPNGSRIKVTKGGKVTRNLELRGDGVQVVWGSYQIKQNYDHLVNGEPEQWFNGSSDLPLKIYGPDDGVICVEIEDNKLKVTTSGSFGNEVIYSRMNRTVEKTFRSNYSQDFSVGFCSDIHLACDFAPKRFKKALSLFQSKGADFVIVNGDLADIDGDDIDRDFVEDMEDWVQDYKLPIYLGYGNHDKPDMNQGWIRDVNKYSYKENKTFNKSGKVIWELHDFNGRYCSYLIKNNWVFFQMNFNAKDINWVKEKAEEFHKKGYKLCFNMHIYNDDNDSANEEIKDLIGEYPDSYIFYGHSHYYNRNRDMNEIQLGTVGYVHNDDIKMGKDETMRVIVMAYFNENDVRIQPYNYYGDIKGPGLLLGDWYRMNNY